MTHIMEELKSKLSEHCLLADHKDEMFYEQAALCDEAVWRNIWRQGVISDETISDLTASRKALSLLQRFCFENGGV